MGARNHPLLENHAYFVTAVAAGRRTIFLDRDAAGNFVECLPEARAEMGFALLSFVVMPDHVHLLFVPARGTTLPQVMQIIKGRWARRWNQKRRNRGQVWQPRYYERIARTEEQIFAWIRYIDENPVKAGLAPVCEAYRFGSACRSDLSDLEAYLSGKWGDQWVTDEAGQAGSLAFEGAGSILAFSEQSQSR